MTVIHLNEAFSDRFFFRQIILKSNHFILALHFARNQHWMLKILTISKMIVFKTFKIASFAISSIFVYLVQLNEQCLAAVEVAAGDNDCDDCPRDYEPPDSAEPSTG